MHTHYRTEGTGLWFAGYGPGDSGQNTEAGSRRREAKSSPYHAYAEHQSK